MNFFQTGRKKYGEVFWNNIFIKPFGEKKISNKDEEFDINPNYLDCFTNTKLTTKPMDNEDESTVFNILEKVGFYSMTDNKGLYSARMEDALYHQPKALAKT